MTPPTETLTPTSMPRLSHRWTHLLAQTYEKYEAILPCPVATQGAHLITPPDTPAVFYPPPGASFTEALMKKLDWLVIRQKIRVNLYGAEFAEEYPISRTPRDLAQEQKARMTKIYEDAMHLYSDSSSESEDTWNARLRGLKVKKKTVGCVKAVLPNTENKVEHPPIQSTAPRPSSSSSARPSSKRKRSSTSTSPTGNKSQKLMGEVPVAPVALDRPTG